MEVSDKLNEFEEVKTEKVNIRLHLGLTCMAYMAFGVGMSVQQLGIKAGLGFWGTTIIFSSCTIFWIIIVFTSMEKIKRILFKKK